MPANASAPFCVIDFVVVLMGYALSGEPTLKAYYERLQPFATAFMALFGRERVASPLDGETAFLLPWTRRVWKRCVVCSCRTR